MRSAVEVPRGRHDTPIVEDNEPHELLPGDMFLLLVGGITIVTQLLSPFQSNAHNCHVCHIMHEPESVRARYTHIQPGFLVMPSSRWCA
jgi:hypothetical protein